MNKESLVGDATINNIDFNELINNVTLVSKNQDVSPDSTSNNDVSLRQIINYTNPSDNLKKFLNVEILSGSAGLFFSNNFLEFNGKFKSSEISDEENNEVFDLLNNFNMKLHFDSVDIISNVELDWEYYIEDYNPFYCGSSYNSFSSIEKEIHFLYEEEQKTGFLFINLKLHSNNISDNDIKSEIINELLISIAMPAYDENDNLNAGFYLSNNNILFNPVLSIDNSLNSIYQNFSDIDTEKWIIKISNVSILDKINIKNSLPRYVDYFMHEARILEPGLEKKSVLIKFPYYIFPTISAYCNFCNKYNNLIEEKVNGTEFEESVNSYVHGVKSKFINRYHNLHMQPLFYNFYKTNSINKPVIKVQANADYKNLLNSVKVNPQSISILILDTYYDPRSFPIVKKNITTTNSKSSIDNKIIETIEQDFNPISSFDNLNVRITMSDSNQDILYFNESEIIDITVVDSSFSNLDYEYNTSSSAIISISNEFIENNILELITNNNKYYFRIVDVTESKQTMKLLYNDYTVNSKIWNLKNEIYSCKLLSGVSLNVYNNYNESQLSLPISILSIHEDTEIPDGYIWKSNLYKLSLESKLNDVSIFETCYLNINENINIDASDNLIFNIVDVSNNTTSYSLPINVTKLPQWCRINNNEHVKNLDLRYKNLFGFDCNSNKNTIFKLDIFDIYGNLILSNQDASFNLVPSNENNIGNDSGDSLFSYSKYINDLSFEIAFGTTNSEYFNDYLEDDFINKKIENDYRKLKNSEFFLYLKTNITFLNDYVGKTLEIVISVIDGSDTSNYASSSIICNIDDTDIEQHIYNDKVNTIKNNITTIESQLIEFEQEKNQEIASALKYRNKSSSKQLNIFNNSSYSNKDTDVEYNNLKTTYYNNLETVSDNLLTAQEDRDNTIKNKTFLLDCIKTLTGDDNLVNKNIILDQLTIMKCLIMMWG